MIFSSFSLLNEFTNGANNVSVFLESSNYTCFSIMTLFWNRKLRHLEHSDAFFASLMSFSNSLISFIFLNLDLLVSWNSSRLIKVSKSNISGVFYPPASDLSRFDALLNSFNTS